MSIAIQSDHLSVRYNLSANRADSLKEYLIRLVRGKLFYEEFWALKDISFSLEKVQLQFFLSLTLQQFMDIRNDFIDLYNVHGKTVY